VHDVDFDITDLLFRIHLRDPPSIGRLGMVENDRARHYYLFTRYPRNRSYYAPLNIRVYCKVIGVSI
jgi:hypothetical protein